MISKDLGVGDVHLPNSNAIARYLQFSEIRGMMKNE
jgi:hypothetical protein